MSSTTIIVAESDYQRLSSLIDSAQSAAAEALDAELSRAEIVADPLLPPDTVAMGSTVTFRDRDSGEQTTVTLVYPREADVDRMRISVLSPVGSALIGLGIGGAIDWPLPGGRQRRLEVIAVQPAEKEVAEP
ncbi:MAG: nucleoside diphosphate kinase regulator [Pseudomonadota bacterium]|nr:nucleoside diphosphate kinase regulator [Pseudomonadota bacterium]